MAKEIEGASRDTFYRAPPEMLVANPTNGRAYAYTREECADLIAQFADPAVGQLQAVETYEGSGTDKGKFTINFGNRRQAAMIFYNEDRAEQGLAPMEIKFTVESSKLKLNAHDRFRKNVIENASRKGHTLIDIGFIVRTERAFGSPDTEICKLFPHPKKAGTFMSPAFIAQCAKFMSLPDDVRRHIHDEVIGYDDACRLLKVEGGDEAVQAVVAEAQAIQAADVPEDNHPTTDPNAEGFEFGATEPTPKKSPAKKKIASKAITKALEAKGNDAALGARKMAEIGKYWEMLVDSSDQPGMFPQPMIDLLKGMIKHRARKLSDKQMTNLFEKCCRVKHS